MYSSITEIPSTGQVQIPSTQNNKLMKIGGAVAVFIIIVIILYFSFSSSESTPQPEKIQKTKPEQVYNKCEIFQRCNFENKLYVGEEYIELKKKYPDINDNTFLNFGSYTIINSNDIKFPDVIIKSIKSEGYIIKLYSKPNFEGDEKILTGKISIECFDEPFRSAIIDR